MSLTLEDLGVDPGDLPYSRFSRNNSRSFLLSREEGEEDCPAEEEFPGEQPDLSYERLHVFYSPIYEICRGALLHQEMELISDPRWQANSVYSGTDWDGTPTLLICWEKDILLLTSNLVPNLSDQQIQIIAQWATA